MFRKRTRAKPKPSDEESTTPSSCRGMASSCSVSASATAGPAANIASSAQEMQRPAFSSAQESIRFETGNPETGATTSGSLVVEKCKGASSIVLVGQVPGLMTSGDFCKFIDIFADSILHIRPLRLSTERNRYVVIVQLRTPDDATNFFQVFQGKPFLRGLVQETCEIREVVSMTFDAPDNPVDDIKGGFPNSAMFPDQADSLPPACPVCLERFDERGAALVTTFCNHTMHAACLAQWELNRCPVCRHIHELTPEASTCMNCENHEDLWMCVVCAYVGCGVYKNKHALEHFAETQHPFAINLEDRTFWSGETLQAGTVWDYSSERFVNRLLCGEDGKIVEVAQDTRDGTAGSSAGDGAAVVCCSSRSGVSSAIIVGDGDEENDRGLQAAVYASRMDAVVDDYRFRMERMEAEHNAEIEKLRAEVRILRGEATESAKTRKALNRRAAEAEKEAKGLRDKNGFLKSLNETLLRDKRGWNDEVEKLRNQLKEVESDREGLREQLRDLMMHLEAQAKISGASESCRSDASELIGGDVLRVGPSPRQRLAMKTNRRTSAE